MRWLLVVTLFAAAVGCRAPMPSFGPYGQTRVPAPATHSYGAPDAYYQQQQPAAADQSAAPQPAASHVAAATHLQPINSAGWRSTGAEEGLSGDLGGAQPLAVPRPANQQSPTSAGEPQIRVMEGPRGQSASQTLPGGMRATEATFVGGARPAAANPRYAGVPAAATAPQLPAQSSVAQAQFVQPSLPAPVQPIAVAAAPQPAAAQAFQPQPAAQPQLAPITATPAALAAAAHNSNYRQNRQRGFPPRKGPIDSVALQPTPAQPVYVGPATSAATPSRTVSAEDEGWKSRYVASNSDG